MTISEKDLAAYQGLAEGCGGPLYGVINHLIAEVRRLNLEKERLRKALIDLVEAVEGRPEKNPFVIVDKAKAALTPPAEKGGA